MNSNDSKFDDLERIDGIGEARQTFLREHQDLQVRTYADLAALSVETVSQAFKEASRGVAESAIEKWLKEAAKLAEEAEEEAAKAKANEAVSPQPANSPAEEAAWESAGIFVVNIRQRTAESGKEYQTEVSIQENGEQAEYKDWPGIQSAAAFEWMLAHAGIEVTDIEGEAPVEAETPPEPAIQGQAQVEVTELRVMQPPDAEEPLTKSTAGAPLPQKIRAGAPFSLDVVFSVGGEGAPSVVASQATYRLRVVATEISKKGSIHLGDSEPNALEEGTLRYHVRSPVTMLSAGKYRLWALVTVQAAKTKPNFLEIPLVEVG